MLIPTGRLLRGLKFACFGFGTLALTYCELVTVGAAVYQSRARFMFNHLRGEFLAHRLSNSGKPAARGSVVAALDSGRIGLSVMVLEGTDERTLGLGAGHMPGSGVPGKAGNVVITGHRDTFFRPLRSIRPGDSIELTSPEGTYQYRVSWTRVVAPNDTRSLKPTRQEVLTLVTCYPFSYIGSAPDRLVVRAKRMGSLPCEDIPINAKWRGSVGPSRA